MDKAESLPKNCAESAVCAILGQVFNQGKKEDIPAHLGKDELQPLSYTGEKRGGKQDE